MAKKKGQQPLAAAKKAAAKKPNPFELKKNKTKFATVGRRIKGATKNVIQARQDATNKVSSASQCRWRRLREWLLGGWVACMHACVEVGANGTGHNVEVGGA